MKVIFQLALLVPTLVPSSFASNTWIVDPSGAGTHTQIQAAIASASDNDVILVRTGVYDSFAVGNKTLSILAEDGAIVDTGTIRVRNLDENRFVLLRGLNAKGVTGLNPSSSLGFYGLNNEGSIRLWECKLEGAGTTFGGVSAWSGMLLDHCADVAIDECTVRGAPNPGFDATPQGTPYPGAGLRAIASGVTLHGTQVVGGNGAEGFDPIAGIAGGVGVELTGCDFFAAGANIVGGHGGAGDAIAGGAGVGGIGLTTENSNTQILDCDVEGGGGGCNFKWFGCGSDAPDGLPFTGNPQILPGTAPDMDGPAIVSTSTLLQLQVSAEPGTRVLLQAGGGPNRIDSPLVQGRLLLSQPFFGFVTPLSGGPSSWSGMPLALYSPLLGTVGSSGFLEVDIPVKSLSGGASHRMLFMQTLTIASTGTRTFGRPLQVLVQDCPSCMLDCDGNGVDDFLDIENGISPDCNQNWIPDSCEADCDGNGIPDVCDLLDGTLLDDNENGVPDACEGSVRVYVDGNAQAGGDGLSWATAFDSLQDGLTEAGLLGSWLEDVWVAAGTYRPADPGGSVGLSFTLDSRLSTRLYGGFAGNETALSQRDLLANPTILSGDLNSNDDLGLWNDNSKVVLRLQGSHRIDGFTIRGGNSTASGGGVSILEASDWVIVNCILENNQGIVLHSTGQGGVLVNSIVRNNQNNFQNSAPIRLACGSGGVQRVEGCLIAGNRALSFFENKAVHLEGPGEHHWSGCTVANNKKMRGVYVSDLANVTFTNNILWGNRAFGASGSALGQQVQIEAGSTFTNTYNNVEGAPAGWAPGNTGANPDFLNPLGADGISGTPDDDYRLGPNSGAVDAGRNAAIPDDASDLDLDGDTLEETPFDLGGDPRRSDDPAIVDSGLGQAPVVDMGAFERRVP